MAEPDSCAAANNQIATWNGQTVGTDADAHITSDPSSESTFAWGNGWLSQITNDAYGTYEYPGYDLLGRRNSEGFVVPCSGQYPQSTYIVYDGLVPVQEQYTEVTSDCATYSYPYTVAENLLTMPGSGEVLALTDSNGNNMVPLHDALGSTQWMVNASGQMQTTFAYSSFGIPSQSGTAYYFPWLFAGMEWSDIGNVSQQYYAGARYYSPGLRRFISPDPMGFAGSGSNLFAYAGNDPVNNSDPTGLDCGGDCGTLGISGAIEGQALLHMGVTSGPIRRRSRDRAGAGAGRCNPSPGRRPPSLAP